MTIKGVRALMAVVCAGGDASGDASGGGEAGSGDGNSMDVDQGDSNNPKP